MRADGFRGFSARPSPPRLGPECGVRGPGQGWWLGGWGLAFAGLHVMGVMG